MFSGFVVGLDPTGRDQALVPTPLVAFTKGPTIELHRCLWQLYAMNCTTCDRTFCVALLELTPDGRAVDCG